MSPPRIAPAPRPAPSPGRAVIGAQVVGPPPAPPKKGDEVVDFFKDGYLKITVDERSRDVFPSRIRLPSGEVATVKRVNGDYEVTLGKRKLLASPDGNGGFRFFEPRPAGVFKPHEGDVLHRGSIAAQPISPSDPLAQVFTESHRVASGRIAPHLDPAGEKAREDLKLLAEVGPARMRADEMVRSSQTWRASAVASARAIAEELAPIAGLAERGLVAISTDAEGKIHLALTRPEGTTDSEWKTLQQRYSGPLRDREQRIQRRQSDQAGATERVNGDAKRLFEEINSPSMKAFLSKLPPEKRLAELTRYASALSGSPEGALLAEQVFGKGKAGTPAVDKGGVLHPEPGSLGAIALQGCYDTPAAKEALLGLSIALLPDLPTTAAERTTRMFEVSYGRKLTPAEEWTAIELSAVSSEEDVEKLVGGHGEAHGPWATRLTLAAEMLTALGHVGHEPGLLAKESGVSEFFHHHAPALRKGAAVFALFGAGVAIYDLIHHGPSAKGVAEVGETNLRALGAFAQLAQKSGESKWLSTFAKGAGIAASGVGLFIDALKLAEDTSPERRDQNFWQMNLGALVLVGTIVAPELAAGGALAKVLMGAIWKTTDSYEEADKLLKQNVW